jgi:hypothetical protein
MDVIEMECEDADLINLVLQMGINVGLLQKRQ